MTPQPLPEEKSKEWTYPDAEIDALAVKLVKDKELSANSIHLVKEILQAGQALKSNTSKEGMKTIDELRIEFQKIRKDNTRLTNFEYFTKGYNLKPESGEAGQQEGSIADNEYDGPYDQRRTAEIVDRSKMPQQEWPTEEEIEVKAKSGALWPTIDKEWIVNQDYYTGFKAAIQWLKQRLK